MTTSPIAPTKSPVAAATTTPTANSTTGTGTSGSLVNNTEIASNFTTFLQLLTTQLKNQDPLSPMDTNQFTQQLVQFAQVEQQLKSNDQLSTLVSLQQTAQSTAALDYVGQDVIVDGSTAQLTNSKATWSFSPTKPATAQISIKNTAGQLVYTNSYTVQAGQQNFAWNGRDSNGTQWPDGAYTISITATDASGQTVAIAPEVQGVVDSADLSQTPPVLSIGGQNFTFDKIKRIVRSN